LTGTSYREHIRSRDDHPIHNLGQGFLSSHAGYGRTGLLWYAQKYSQLQPMQCARRHAIFPLTVSVTVRECGGSIGHREQIITTVLNIQFDGCRTARGRTAWMPVAGSTRKVRRTVTETVGGGHPTLHGSSVQWFRRDGGGGQIGSRPVYPGQCMALRRAALTARDVLVPISPAAQGHFIANLAST
jgi:hypothetical protein